MTRKNKIGLIITIVFLMVFFTIILTPSIGGMAILKDLKYLIDNGREVEGDIIELKKGRSYVFYIIASNFTTNTKKMELFGKHTTIGVSAKIEPTS